MSATAYKVTAGVPVICDSGDLSVTPTVNTRAAALNTAYQPSATRPTLVFASVTIALVALGNAKIEMLCDAANPPTTVRGTIGSVNGAVATASTVGGQLCVLVPAAHYYKLLTTDTVGINTFAVIGNVQEVVL